MRLDYFMRGLKKLRGTPQKKKGVTRAMMLAIRSVLDLTDPDDCVLWCSLLFAFHFMCRSAEYCAKGAEGSFYLDEVVLMSNVTFFRDGVRLFSDFHLADEVRAIFGATKRGGGETRSVWRAGGPLCLVTALADMLEFEPRRDSDIPLFSWFAGSTRAGAGVRYFDIMKIIKQAAVLLGESASNFGSHSIRRGAATCYLQVMPYEWVRMHGRWRSDCAREYVELLGDEAKDYVHLVVAGKRLPRMVPTATNPQMARPHRTQNAWLSGGIRFASCRPPDLH